MLLNPTGLPSTQDSWVSFLNIRNWTNGSKLINRIEECVEEIFDSNLQLTQRLERIKNIPSKLNQIFDEEIAQSYMPQTFSHLKDVLIETFKGTLFSVVLENIGNAIKSDFIKKETVMQHIIREMTLVNINAGLNKIYSYSDRNGYLDRYHRFYDQFSQQYPAISNTLINPISKWIISVGRDRIITFSVNVAWRKIFG